MTGRELFEEASANWNTRLPWDQLSPETQEFWNKRAERQRHSENHLQEKQ